MDGQTNLRHLFSAMGKVRKATPTACAGTHNPAQKRGTNPAALNPAQRKRGTNPGALNPAHRGREGCVGDCSLLCGQQSGLGRSGGLPEWTPQIASCQDVVFSSSDETSTAVLKPAPQQGSWRDAGFPKQPGSNFTDGV